MKLFKYNIFAIALALFSMVGCSNEEIKNDGDVMKFTTSSIETRAGLTDAAITDFGLSIGSNSNADLHSNVKVSRPVFGWEPSEEILWKDAPYTIWAYYPYEETFHAHFTVQNDQSSEEGFTKSEFLHARVTNFTKSSTDNTDDIYYNTVTGMVNIKFKRMLAEFVVRVKIEGSNGSENISKLELKQVATAGEVNPAGTVTAYSNRYNVIAHNNLDAATESGVRTATFKAILFPHTLNSSSTNFSIDVTIDDIVYSWKINNQTLSLTSGNTTTLEVVLKR